MTRAELQLQDPDKVLLVDIRELSEFRELPTYPGAVHIPLVTLLDQARLGQLPKDKRIVTICRSGARSLMVNPILEKLGYQTDLLEGGLQRG
jgi:rhodanese-related sulfurtransferase